MQRYSRHTLPSPLLFLLFLHLFLCSACAQGPRQKMTSPDSAIRQGLAGTSWQLHSIQSMADEQPTINVDKPESYTLHFLDDGHATLKLNCNRGMSQWQATPAVSGESGQLTFGPIAMTRMFCSPPSLDERIARDLGFVRSYLLRDGNLYLSLMADGGVYEWLPETKQP
ncbi:MAG: META domain-containing protein [Desulfobulbus sp.]